MGRSRALAISIHSGNSTFVPSGRFMHAWSHIYTFLTGARHNIYVKGTNAFFLERASLSSLPFAIDNLPKAGKSGGTEISDLVVDPFNGCKIANLKAGSLLPLSTEIVATNFDQRKEERYYTMQYSSGV